MTGTIPIVSATSDRAFSAMRRVKYWLRSTMVLERFSNLALLCAERDLINTMDNNKKLERFSPNNKYRKIDISAYVLV